MKGLTIEQMEFLVGKGLSAEELLAFAKMSEKPRTANAERQARFRRRRKGIPTNESLESVTHNVTHNALPPPIEDHTPPVSSDEETRPPARKSKSDCPAKPSGVNDQTWTDFLKVRTKKRAPMTPTALAGIEDEARKAGWTLEAALAKCAVKGWQSFEADWVANAGKPPGSSSNDGNSFLDHLMSKQPTA